MPKTRLSDVRRRLPRLFSQDYPQVLNHFDLQEPNIYVSIAGEGHVDGVVDWVDARVSPFGMSLYGLETLLGFLGQSGWVWHARNEHLRGVFREEFYKTAGSPNLQAQERLADIEAARALAILRLYAPREHQDPDSREAFLTMLEAFLEVRAL
ncbi:hypothetical protein B0H63DRAFT_188212 [Podospora didyma]|uniref:Aminoglycoside phosphotransferase domain-containing protein n=1 Tax=Podospora didyma TaxID=330526 RepID=A0AAE0NQK2_9PEZI|nr:hypothetical protein B0H63DRAFT_188212 [Podospora didyma]